MFRSRKSVPQTRRKGFLRRRDGSMAVEFGMLALPFFALTVGLLEVSIMQLQRAALSHAMSESYRPIFTGQTRTADPGDFKNLLCEQVVAIAEDTCKENLKIVLEELADYDSQWTQQPDFDQIQENFAGGNSVQGDAIMLLRVYYKYEFMAPLMKHLFDTEQDSMVFAEHAAFRTEPF